MLENPAQAAQIQQAVKDWQEEAKIQEAWNTFKNSSDYQTWQKETETESRKYLSLLSSAAVIYAQKNPKAGAQLLAQTLPVFAAAGAKKPPHAKTSPPPLNRGGRRIFPCEMAGSVA